MGISIVTLKEAETSKAVAKKYNEAFEMITGLAKQDYFCDNTGVDIKKGEKCAVIMCLPTKDHPNYYYQKDMMYNYVTQGKEKSNEN